MQIGFNAPTSGPLIEPDSLSRIITEGEALGFDYATVSDHIMVPRNLESKPNHVHTGRCLNMHKKKGRPEKACRPIDARRTTWQQPV